MKKTLKEIVSEVKKELKCNCDLDNWQPYTDTGHSWVCRIDKEARKRFLHSENSGYTASQDKPVTPKLPPKICHHIQPIQEYSKKKGYKKCQICGGDFV